MKKFIYTITYIILVGLLTSCFREEQIRPQSEEPLSESPRKSGGIPVFIDESMSSSVGKYEAHFGCTDFYVQISSLKSDPLNEEFLGLSSGAVDSTLTKAAGILTPPHQVFVDGIPVGKQPQITRSGQKANALKDLYGKTIEYEFIPNSGTKSTNEPTVITQYVPQQLTITSPRVTCPEEMYPVCHVHNFILKWNADPQNNNGLIVCVEWIGKKLYGEDIEGSYVRRTAFIPEDDGETTLDPKIFNHIPNTALVYITLLRGGIDNVMVGDYSYNISNETHAILPIILARKIKHM